VAAGAREILATEPGLRLCVLAVSEREPDVIASVLAGVRGYLLLDASPDRLVRSLATVAGGGALIAPRMAARLLSAFAALPGGPAPLHDGPDALTEREREILTMVAGGASNRQIAEELWISPHTVKVHVHNILEKLRVRNRGHAVALAVQEHLVSPSLPTTVRVARPAHDHAPASHGFFASQSAAHLARLAE
jgi:DNA-binding NarL/FixJ family response regulator